MSDHFPIFTISMKRGLDSNDKKVTIKKENNKCGLDSRTHGYFVWSGLGEPVFNI